MQNDAFWLLDLQEISMEARNGFSRPDSRISSVCGMRFEVG
jgi:hypothetical protein